MASVIQEEIQLPTCISDLRKIQHVYNFEKEDDKLEDDDIRTKFPNEYPIIKYSVEGSLKNGRPLGSVIVVTAGSSGAGKSSTINEVFATNLCKTASAASTSCTKDVTLYWKNINVADETPRVVGRLGFIDVPGFSNDTEGSDAENIAAIRQIKGRCKDLQGRTIKQARTNVYPNIILFMLKATEKRFSGQNSPVAQSLREFKLCNLIDPKNHNLIIVLTHVMSLSRDDSKVVSGLEEITKKIQKVVYDCLEIWEVPVIPVENRPEEQGLVKVGDFYKLPNDDYNHLNLFNAMVNLADMYDDYLGKLFISWFFAPERAKTQLATKVDHKDRFEKPNQQEVKDVVDSFKSHGIVSGCNKNEKVSIFEFQSFGKGFCPKTGTYYHCNPFATTSGTKVVTIGSVKYSLPSYVTFVSGKTAEHSTKFRTESFQEKEDYEQFLHARYKLEADFALVVSANQSSKWGRSKSSKSESYKYTFVFEREVGRLTLQDINNLPISTNLKSDLDDMPDTYSGAMDSLFTMFFSKWGTHLVCEQAIGGAFNWECIAVSKKDSHNRATEAEFELEAKFKAVFSADAEYKDTSESESMVDNNNENFTIIGGTSGKISSFEAFKAERDRWLESIKDNPKELPGVVCLIPYFQFLGMTPKAVAFREATKAYLAATPAPSRYEVAKQQVEDAKKKQIDPITKEGASCFPIGSHVVISDCLRLPIQNLTQTTPSVHTLSIKNGRLQHISSTRVCTYLHMDDSNWFSYIQLTFSNGKTLSASADHLIFKYDALKKKPKLQQVKEFNIGDKAVFFSHAAGIETPVLIRTSVVKALGAYCPLTASGTLLVDGFFVTCYSNTRSFQLAQLSMLPLKIFSKYKYSKVTTESLQRAKNQGIRPYATILMRLRSQSQFLLKRINSAYQNRN